MQINSNAPKNKKQEVLTTTAGVAAGCVANKYSKKCISKLGSIVIKPKILESFKLSPSEYKEISDSFEPARLKTKLCEKGLSFIDTTEDWCKQRIKFYQSRNAPQEKPIVNLLKNLFKKDFKTQTDKMISTTRSLQNGTTALFVPLRGRKGVVHINMKKGILPIFHEVGHAHNHLKSIVGYLLQSSRKYCPKVVLGILVASLLTSKKAKGEKPKGFFDKTTNFVKENAGKLSFLAMMPIIAEEAMASVKGVKMAKEFVSSPLLKHMKISYAWALSSYILSAASLAGGVFAANKVKDAIAK